MLTKIFLRLASVKVFKRLFWKPIYNFLAKRFPQNYWQFMNHGYALSPDSAEPELTLPATYEFQRYPLQMYHYLAALGGPIDGKDVLEVASGRGGGANYLFHQFHPASYIGLDCADNAVSMSNQNFSKENLRFVTGNAEKLPFQREQFDVVINIEASRHFGCFKAFLSEVNRVLKPGGKLLFVDWRMASELAEFNTSIRNSGLKIVSSEDISTNVLTSLDKLDGIYEETIRQNVPRWIRGYYKQFAAAKGSFNYEDLKRGNRRYYRFVLQKS